MCGRYSLTTPVEAMRRLFGFEERPNLAPRYNIAPTQSVPIVRARGDGGGGRELVMVRWGLVPSWAEDAAIGAKLINARAETVAEKPSFRGAFAKRRCLVPADGFYEWRREEGGRQPYRVAREDGGAFAFAGLWERWRDPAGEVVESCAIITTDANDLLRPIHHRMPVILDGEAIGAWLAGAPTEAAPLLVPAPVEGLTAYKVSRRVNKVANDDEACIEPWEGQESLL